MLYCNISPVVAPIIRANESTGTSLRTQWISLKIFRCRPNLILHLRGKNILAYYAPLSLSQYSWMVHQWKKYHSQTYRSKAEKICTFFVSYFTSWQVRCPLWAHSACLESTGHPSMGLFQIQNSPGRYAHTMQHWELPAHLLTTESELRHSPGKPLASEPGVSCAGLETTQARAHLELGQIPTERCQIVGCPFCKKNLVCWMQPTDIVGNVFVY